MMGVEMWLLILAGYVLGLIISWVIAFRLLAADDLIGVQTAQNPGEAIGTIIMSGFLGLMIALFWPIVALIFSVYRWAVAPAMKKRGSHE